MNTLKLYVKELKAEFKRDDVPLLAAAQAYYFLLSIFPLMLVAFTIIPYLNIDPADAIEFMRSVLPGEIARIFEENIVSLIETPRGGLLTVGIIGALWSASNAVNAFIKASNDAYEVEETRSFILVRLLALGLTIGMIAALVIAILLPVFGSVLIDSITSFLGLGESLSFLFQLSRWAVSIVAISAILMLLYHIAPNKKIPFKDIMPGALAASILWLLISLAFSFYVSNFGNYSATYGSLGGIIILMIWFFLTGMILMVGAEINVVNNRIKHGRLHTNKAKQKSAAGDRQ